MRFKKFEPGVKIGNHAVVVGGGITGMLSARVLADYFASVTIIETDKLPQNPAPRRGVPQSVQPHVLLAGGYRILQELFPNIETELAAAGAVEVDFAQEFHLFGDAGWNANTASPSNIVSFSCSRSLLEWAIRQQLSKFSNVRFVEQHRVTELLCNSSKDHVTGVYIRSIDGAVEDKIPASLVVDASGRGSSTPDWLKNIGLAPPPETVVEPFLGYATCCYREPEGFQAEWKVMSIAHSPPNVTRRGYLAKIEGGKWIATLGGYGRDFPPTDRSGFLEFARSLSSPKFYEAIVHAEPVSPIYAYRANANRVRHYENIIFPQGLVVLGDAVCTLCPVYGQGMTVSALAVMVLRDWLNGSPSKKLDVNHFQKRLAKSNFSHWILATALDSRFPTTQGRREPGVLSQLLHKYNKQLLIKATSDPSLHVLLMEVGNALKSPLAFYNPLVAFKVLSR